MIDIFNEQILRLQDAAKLIPGRSVGTATIYRWANKGVNGCKLETAQVGGAKVTSKEAIKRFVDTLSQPAIPEARATKPNASTCEKRIEIARQKLNHLLGSNQDKNDKCLLPDLE